MTPKFIFCSLLVIVCLNNVELGKIEEKLIERDPLRRDKRASSINSSHQVIFEIIMKLFGMKWDTNSDTENQRQVNTAISKLNTVEKGVKIPFYRQYEIYEQDILRTYRKRALLLNTDKNRTEKYLQAFMNYYKNQYGAAGGKIFNALFKKNNMLWENVMKAPTSKSKCYKLHVSVLVLFSKASIIELSYVMKKDNKPSDIKAMKQTAQRWKTRIEKYQNAKFKILCNKLGTRIPRPTSKPSKFKEFIKNLGRHLLSALAVTVVLLILFGVVFLLRCYGCYCFGCKEKLKTCYYCDCIAQRRRRRQYADRQDRNFSHTTGSPQLLTLVETPSEPHSSPMAPKDWDDPLTHIL